MAPFGLSYIRPVFDPELRPKGAHVEGRVEDRPGFSFGSIAQPLSRQGGPFFKGGVLQGPPLLKGDPPANASLRGKLQCRHTRQWRAGLGGFLCSGKR